MSRWPLLWSQLLNSGSNFAMLALSAASIPVNQFGGLSVVISGFYLVTSVIRGAITYQWQLEIGRSARLSQADWRWLPALFWASILGAAALTTASVGATALPVQMAPILCVGIAAALLQDGTRLGLIAGREPRAAAVSDGVWVGIQALLSLMLLPFTPWWAFVSWLVAAAASAAVAARGLLDVGAPVSRLTRWRSGIEITRDNLSSAKPLVFEAVLGQAAVNLFPLFASLSAGLSTVGQLQTSRLFLRPLNIVGNAVAAASLPEFARADRSGAGLGTVRRRFIWLSLGAWVALGLGGLSVGLAVTLYGSGGVLVSVLLLATIEHLFWALSVPLLALLRAQRQYRRLLLATGTSGLLSTGAALLLGAYGATWLALGLLVSAASIVLISYVKVEDA